MAATQSLIGLLGATLLLARLGLALGPGRRSFRFAVLAAAVSLIPIGGLPVAGYVRGVIGDLSLTSLVLLGWGFVGDIARKERLTISAMVVAGATFVYPMALGLGAFDPYRLGFAPRGLLMVLLALAVVAWVYECYVLLACLTVAAAGHALRLMESTNLWDYLLDPWVAVVSLFYLGSALARLLSRRE